MLVSSRDFKTCQKKVIKNQCSKNVSQAFNDMRGNVCQWLCNNVIILFFLCLIHVINELVGLKGTVDCRLWGLNRKPFSGQSNSLPITSRGELGRQLGHPKYIIHPKEIILCEHHTTRK